MRADGWSRLPLIRMTNVSVMPGSAGTLEDLIADTDDGIYMDTNRSWSIDDRRLNFQFGTQVGWEIKNGKRTTMLRRVRNIAATGRAVFVVDRWSEDWRELAYVLVEGPAEVLEDGRERDEALILLTAKYPQYDDLQLAGNLVIKLTAERTLQWHA